MKKIEEPIHTDNQESKKLLIKQCHCCGHVQENTYELDRCSSCQKSYLPLKYFEKIHDIHNNFTELFSKADELDENDLIKGLLVLW